MKVIWINHTATVAGSEHSLLVAIDEAPAGDQHVVVCPSGPLSDLLARRGVRHLPIPEVDVSFKPSIRHTPRGIVALLRAQQQLRRIVADEKPAVVIANTSRAGLVALRMNASVPLVGYLREHLPARIGAAALHPVMARAHTVIANSRSTAATLPRGRAHIRVVYNAVDRARFSTIAPADGSAVREDLGIDAAAIVMSVVAYLAPKKAQDDAIRALAQMTTDKDVYLLLVGKTMFPRGRFDGASFELHLRSLAEELGVESRVHFLGQREDAPAIIQASDVLLVPSWSEPFGRTIIEAMSCGCTVVASATGGPPEIIEDGIDGVLVPPRQPGMWAQTLDRLVNEPTTREQLGIAAKSKTERAFQPSSYAAALHGIALAAVQSETPPVADILHVQPQLS